MTHYEYDDCGYGVTLTSPTGETVFLQGDDSENFLNEIESLDSVWEDNNWESPNPSCFPTYEHHLDFLIDAYF